MVHGFEGLQDGGHGPASYRADQPDATWVTPTTSGKPIGRNPYLQASPAMTLVIEPGDSSRLQAVPVRWILQDAAQTAKRSPLVADASGSSPAACTS